MRRNSSSEGFLLFESTGDADLRMVGSLELREVLLLLETLDSEGFIELREVLLLLPGLLLSESFIELRELLLLRGAFSPDVLRSPLIFVEGEEKRL